MVREALGKFCGVLLTDGYSVYERFAQKTSAILHAQCWAHTRRQFEKAQGAEPRLVAEALKQIGNLYKEEAKIRALVSARQLITGFRQISGDGFRNSNPRESYGV